MKRVKPATEARDAVLEICCWLDVQSFPQEDTADATLPSFGRPPLLATSVTPAVHEAGPVFTKATCVSFVPPLPFCAMKSASKSRIQYSTAVVGLWRSIPALATSPTFLYSWISLPSIWHVPLHLGSAHNSTYSVFNMFFIRLRWIRPVALRTLYQNPYRHLLRDAVVSDSAAALPPPHAAETVSFLLLRHPSPRNQRRGFPG